MEIDYFKYVDNFSKYKNVKSEAIIEGKIRNPKITIAIPTYKRNHLIKDALDSALNQKGFDNYEVIIVDNDDNFNNKELEKILREYNNEKISYYKNEKNIGIFGNWNRCIELAKGEYISILNDDDWLEKNFLKEGNDIIKENSNDGVYIGAKIVDLRENRNNSNNSIKSFIKKYIQIKDKRKLTINNFIIGNKNNSYLLKREKMIEIGGYNEIFFPISDYAFSVNYCLNNKVYYLKKILYNYGIQENESMNEKTGYLFPQTSFNLRKNILIKLNKNNKFYNKLIETIYEKEKKYVNKFWKINISYNEEKINFLVLLYLKIRNIIMYIY